MNKVLLNIKFKDVTFFLIGYFLFFQITPLISQEIQNKIHFQNGLYTTIYVINNNSTIYNQYSDATRFSTTNFKLLPLGISPFWNNKIAFTVFENKLLSTSYYSSPRYSPYFIKINLSNKDTDKSLNEFPKTSHNVKDIVYFDKIPLLEQYRLLAVNKKIITHDLAYLHKDIYLITLNSQSLKIWKYQTTTNLSNPEPTVATLVHTNSLANTTKFTSIAIKNKLLIIANDNNIYEYTDNRLKIIEQLPKPYEDCLFIINRDMGKLFYIKKEDFLKAKTMSEITQTEIKL